MFNREIKLWEFVLLALFVLFFVCLLLWTARQVFASVLYSQEIKDANSTSLVANQAQWQKLGNGLSGRINSFILYLDNSASGWVTKEQIDIRGFTNSTYTTASTTSNCGLGDTASSLWGTNDNVAATTTEDITKLNTAGYFLFSRFEIKPNGCLLDAALYYAFKVSYSNVSGHDPYGAKVGGSVANTWSTTTHNYKKGAVSSGTCDTAYPNCAADANISDIYFIAGYNLSLIPMAAITYPIGAITGYPTNWFWSAENLTASTNYVGVINYTNASSTLGEYAAGNWFTETTFFSTGTSTSFATSTLMTTGLNASDTYKAYFEIFKPPSGTPVGTSPSISFRIVPNPVFIENASSTLSGFTISTCNQDVDWFTGVLCAVFVPKSTTLTQFNGLYSKIEKKPPMGYLAAITGIMASTSTDTSTFIGNLGSVIPNSTSSPFTIFRTSMNWVLWLFFGVFVFRKGKNIDLW
jgi:hypothetical protein